MADFIKVGTSLDALTAIPAPNDWGWSLMDISAPDAGRTQDGDNTMYKMRVNQKRKLQPTWKNRSASDVSTILQAFQPEYVYVQYLDALTNSYQVRQFYTGDKQVSMRTLHIGGAVYSQLSFSIIER